MTNEEVINQIQHIEGIACPIHGIETITISDGDGSPSSWSDFCTECAEEESEKEPPELIPAREYIEKLFLQALQDKDDEWRGKIGLLRQYLNERTSKDLITNEELETFLLK